MTAPSPFIAGTNIQWAWDSTSLGWLKECPRKYYYHMIEGLRSRGEAVHLEFGIYYHQALEFYDRKRAEGASHDEAVEIALTVLLADTWIEGKPWRSAADLNPDDKASLKNREYLVRTVVWYLEKFRNDPAKTVIMADGRPMVELHFQFNLDFHYRLEHPYSLCGYLDRVVEFNEQRFVMDRKTTTTTLSPHYYEQFDPDNQITLYTAASMVAFHTPVMGVIIDAAQIMVGGARFGRSIIQKTRDQVEEWLAGLKVWLVQAEWFAEHKHWPMNDKSCHKYGGCPFRTLCSKSPSVRDKFIESNFERHPWNPLELRG